MTKEKPSHPMQPLEIDEVGTIRFRSNAIVEFMLLSFDLNDISRRDWPDGDYTQLMQLLGYSVSGYGDLSTSPDHLVEAADELAEDMMKEMK